MQKNVDRPINRLTAYLSSLFTITVLGFIVMLLTYAFCIAFLYDSSALSAQVKILHTEVIRTVVIEGLHSSLGSTISSLPWPDGVTVARIQGRLPDIKPIWFHVSVNAIAFSIIGVIVGKSALTRASIVLPLALFFQTHGFLRGEFYQLVPFNLIPIAAVILMQVLAVVGFSYIARQSTQR